MNNDKKIYFVSDAHLGLPNGIDTLTREKKLVAWLESIRPTAEMIFLMGDIFDFWFEYKKVVPKGFTRLLGKLAEITDSGISVHFFTGNHDLWEFGYLASETGMIIHHHEEIMELNGKRFFLAHGDGLGPYDKGYKRLKKLFSNRVAQWAFGWLHPNIGIGLAHYWSHKSRYAEGEDHIDFQGENKEWLIMYAKDLLQKEHFDYFVFGHRHVVKHLDLGNGAELIYLGDWLNNFSYGEFNGKEFVIKYFK
ncbi:MAG: UDP-2,3-diacylglucosamine diphosphatase [Candidatus Zixiibacteriota bacterium]|nr:MAG: UDP-2,3-diacylglucosamine diphosphatase [candidate division Zixibacteria bacterium]